MQDVHVIRDLVYFDFDKSASIFSQLEGGLLREIESGSESGSGTTKRAGIDLRVLQAQIGQEASGAISQLEKRIVHHDLLARVETALFSQGFAIDINTATSDVADLNGMTVRDALFGAPYVRAEGWITIEDFPRLKEFAQSFNDICTFIARTQLENLAATPEIGALLARVDQAKAAVDKVTDRNRKARDEAALESLEAELAATLRRATEMTGIPEWLADGICQFIDLFTPHRTVLRLSPISRVPNFQLICNLKRDCFVDNDLETTIYAYGTRPNVQLTIFGLVTSVPPLGDHPYDPDPESTANRTSDEEKHAKMEEAFRGVFRSMEEFEAFVRFCTYPSIIVYPLAVYRSIRPY